MAGSRFRGSDVASDCPQVVRVMARFWWGGCGVGAGARGWRICLAHACLDFIVTRVVLGGCWTPWSSFWRPVADVLLDYFVCSALSLAYFWCSVCVMVMVTMHFGPFCLLARLLTS